MKRAAAMAGILLCLAAPASAQDFHGEGFLDLRLAATSPAIDQGNDAVAPATDLSGLSRDVDAPAANGAGGYSDIGAYEYGH